jgi:capsule polysaccharide export protein KpsE/RkpR
MLGKADSAAASLVARTRAMEAELADARRLEHREWIESLHKQIESLHKQIDEGRQTIAAMQSSRAWRLAEGYRRMRRRFRRPTSSD